MNSHMSSLASLVLSTLASCLSGSNSSFRNTQCHKQTKNPGYQPSSTLTRYLRRKSLNCKNLRCLKQMFFLAISSQSPSQNCPQRKKNLYQLWHQSMNPTLFLIARLSGNDCSSYLTSIAYSSKI